MLNRRNFIKTSALTTATRMRFRLMGAHYTSAGRCVTAIRLGKKNARQWKYKSREAAKWIAMLGRGPYVTRDSGTKRR